MRTTEKRYIDTLQGMSDEHFSAVVPVADPAALAAQHLQRLMATQQVEQEQALLPLREQLLEDGATAAVYAPVMAAANSRIRSSVQRVAAAAADHLAAQETAARLAMLAPHGTRIT